MKCQKMSKRLKLTRMWCDAAKVWSVSLDPSESNISDVFLDRSVVDISGWHKSIIWANMSRKICVWVCALTYWIILMMVHTTPQHCMNPSSGTCGYCGFFVAKLGDPAGIVCCILQSPTSPTQSNYNWCQIYIYICDSICICDTSIYFIYFIHSCFIYVYLCA